MSDSALGTGNKTKSLSLENLLSRVRKAISTHTNKFIICWVASCFKKVTLEHRLECQKEQVSKIPGEGEKEGTTKAKVLERVCMWQI